jgi:UDP-N-acetylglucosamine/UDP-N-acetylgalactosamine diphosphorylase
MPLLNEDGKVMINKKFEIKEASDGNGCIYKALKKNGLLDKMKQEGTEWIFVGSVDNVLVHMVDPLLVGLTIKENNLIGSKSIIKSGPHERVGVFCKKNSKPGIIEYSEMPEEMAEETDEEGELVFADSNIVCHLYNIEAMEKLADVKLPYHSAHKKADFMQLDGEMFKATEPNAYKYEAFIFD